MASLRRDRPQAQPNSLASVAGGRHIAAKGLGISRSTEGSWNLRGPSVFLASGARGSYRRLAEAAQLQAIEGNPLTPDELAMFEMFERERWSPEDRRAYIERQIRSHRRIAPAE